MWDELTVEDLPVRGEIPRDLAGVYMRNGPNPAFPPISYTWPFDGDGMVHALYFAEGRAAYRNRFVLTAGLRAERRAGRALYGGLAQARPARPRPGRPRRRPRPVQERGQHQRGPPRRPHAGAVGGRAALRADARPETRGVHDFAGRVQGALTAHPKLDPATGEMLAFRYGAARAAPALARTVAAAELEERVNALGRSLDWMTMSGLVAPVNGGKGQCGVDGINAALSAARRGQAPQPRSGAPETPGLRAAHCQGRCDRPSIAL